MEEGFATAREAHQYREDQLYLVRERKAEMDRGWSYTIPEWTMQEAFTEWMETHKYEIAPSTARTKRDNWRKHIAPTFGDLHPRDVTPAMISMWQNERMSTGLDVETVRGLRGKILSGLFKWMIANRDRTYPNPLTGVKRAQYSAEQTKGGDHIKDPTRVLSDTQEIDLLHAMREVEPRFVAMIQVALDTGLRPGELYGLRSQVISVEDDHGVISVEHRIVTEAGTPVSTNALKGEPKSIHSRRRVLVPLATIEVIKAHVAEYGLSREGYIFSMPNGKMIDGPEFTNRSTKHRIGALVRAARASGLEDHAPEEVWQNITPYTLRHTNISKRRSGGQDMAFIQQQVGHAPGSVVTSKHYVRVVPGTEQANLDLLAPVTYDPSLAPVIPIRRNA